MALRDGMRRVGDFLREGAADVFGFGGEMEQLRETAADARMLARAVEDASFGNLGPGQTDAYFDPPRESRIATVRRAYRYFFDDVIVRRSVLLMTNYVFSKGVGVPRYRRDPQQGDQDDEYQQATQLIANFWKWPENKRVLTTHKAQKMKQIELMIQSNVFIAMFRQEGDEGEAGVTSIGGSMPTGDQRRPRPTMVLSNVKDREIVEIIGHPDNDTIPVWYKRVWTPREYDFTASSGMGRGGYAPKTTQVTRFYRDWENEPPTVWNGQPWGPPEALIGDGVIYHVSTNLVSDMKFGISELRSVLKWSTGLNQFMTNRMMVSQAISALALQARTKGGPQAVAQVASRLQDISRLASQVEGGMGVGTGDASGTGTAAGLTSQTSAGLMRSRPDTGRTKVAVTSQDVDLQPMVADTGAAGAQTDASILMGQAAAGTGVAKQHLGITDQPSLATATSLDMPTQRGAEDWQEGWERAFREIVGYMLEGEGFDPDKLEVQMPPILSRDVAQLAMTLTALEATVDPNASNRNLMRWVFTKVLEALGEANPVEIVDDLFPEGFQTPYEQHQDELQQQLAATNGAPLPSAAGGRDEAQTTGTQQGATAMLAAGQRAQVAANNGRRQGAEQPGGPGASLDRAAARVNAMLNSGGQSGMLSEQQFVDETFADLDDLPDELREAAVEAYRSLTELVG